MDAFLAQARLELIVQEYQAFIRGARPYGQNLHLYD